LQSRVEYEIGLIIRWGGQKTASDGQLPPLAMRSIWSAPGFILRRLSLHLITPTRWTQHDSSNRFVKPRIENRPYCPHPWSGWF